MDLLNIENSDLYFAEPLQVETQRALEAAAESYGSAEAETLLLHAYAMEPKHPLVLVGLYRFYYYQHRLEDALRIAEE
ncbi:MAG: hypothetical protein HQL49_08515, partial [Gammaproteobacteria bacterium]|nr:hypothetical protein [Gammaproteobacteria bacterium]